jgi:3-methyl-2-oxobutanoate hydroxymethyltransferase
MKQKLTVRDLLALKGRRQIKMTNAPDYNTAKAAEAAGIDIIAGRGMYDENAMVQVLDQIRAGAPNTLIACNVPPTVAYISDAEAIRIAMVARDHGADIIYSSGNAVARLRAIADVGIPTAGHVGLVPIRSTWLGGLRAVGKTVDEAVTVYRDTMEFQRAGAILVEMECVAEAVASEIARRTDLLVISLGSGPGCDGQFLFSSDMLGVFENRHVGLGSPYEGPFPRHAKRFADLHAAAVCAFEAFIDEVDTGRFPAPENVIGVSPEALEAFRGQIEGS